MPGSAVGARAQAVRRFNRFYTKHIGVLGDGVLASPFSLSEVRVLYELAHRTTPTATALATDLGLDDGYLSRMLGDFRRRGLIRGVKSARDARARLLTLTTAGRRAFATLDSRSNDEVAATLQRLSAGQQRRMLGAMREIEAVLAGTSASHGDGEAPYTLRPHRPGDMGWIVHRHGALYHEEYGWDERFEGVVAGIVAEFIARFDPKSERCWVAERDGEAVGCVFLVRKSAKVAKLRLLLVEPSARGVGLGARLVDECIRQAERFGYRRITLWTNDILHAARHIYVKAGFRLVREDRHHMFGPEMVGQTWELALRRRASGAAG